MNSESVILRDVSIGYKQRHSQRLVAQHLSAAIRSGQLTCLLGENGVGKSTLLRTLSGFQPRMAGEITISGRPLDAYSPQHLARKIGVVLTERPDIQQMTVTELVSLGRAPYTDFWGRLSEEDEDICQLAIQQVGIEKLSSRLVSTLSDGERQKVMIAKALAQQTPIIYLDEPTAFLDYSSKVDMLLLLRRISHQADKTIFLSTHDLELALQVAVRHLKCQGGVNVTSSKLTKNLQQNRKIHTKYLAVGKIFTTFALPNQTYLNLYYK